MPLPRIVQLAWLGCLTLAIQTGLALSALAQLQVTPARVELTGPRAVQQLLVTGTVESRQLDLTRAASFRAIHPELVQVSAGGVMTPLANGTTQIEIKHGSDTALVEVVCQQLNEPAPLSFELDVQPVLTAFGCNAGACHGKARGQNGFALSLLGFDSDFDYEQLTLTARGRRLFPAAPRQSLLLQKALAEVPHGGGRRLNYNSAALAVLEEWIASGAPRRVPGETQLKSVSVSPTSRFMQPGDQQQLIVTAEYADGTHRDVTGLSSYSTSDDAVVEIDAHGLITGGTIPGEATLMVRYMGMIGTSHVAIPLAGEVPDELYASLPRKNLIDNLVWDKLKSLKITPSQPVGDAKYLRRVHIDLIGRLPTPDEVRAFLSDTSPDKRAKLVDALLERPEYANHWANKWADLLRPNPYRVGAKAVLNYDSWIRDAFRHNIPYDQFVRELITARGSTWKNGATTLYRDRRSPEEVGPLISQLFLGIRLECAKCHQHPFERWGQTDFYSFAAYFGRVGHRGGIGPPISGNEEKVFLTPKSAGVKHPLTGVVLAPRPLFGTAPASEDPAVDPRQALADWVTGEQNEYFAQVMVNRVWADLMGTGIVVPVDDLRATNPPSNGPLLSALAVEFRQQKFDLKALLRLITASQTYALSSEPNERNTSDLRNYSRHYRQRLRAEVLLDATCDITGLPEKFAAMPPESRSSELWTYRVGSDFLDTFGRPDENLDPPCERTLDSTVTQVLHLMNSPQLHTKVISDEGRAAELAASPRSVDQIVEELYLLTYNRFPDELEKEVAQKVFAAPEATRRSATEDLLWALLNTPEFVFKD